MADRRQWDAGFPGTRGHVITPAAHARRDAARAGGYDTMRVGKWHLAPDEQTQGRPVRQLAAAAGASSASTASSTATPTSSTPTWCTTTTRRPATARRTRATTSPRTWSTTPIGFVRDQVALAPDRPFFLYLAFGAAPLAAPGAGRVRREVPRRATTRAGTRSRAPLARQLELGIVPERHGAAAAQPRASSHGTTSPTTSGAFAARLQEAYAAFLDHTDTQLGRLVDYLARHRASSTTRIFVLLSDNGASQEGGPTACTSTSPALQRHQPETWPTRVDAARRDRRARAAGQLPVGLGAGLQHAAASATSGTPTAAACATR